MIYCLMNRNFRLCYDLNKNRSDNKLFLGMVVGQKDQPTNFARGKVIWRGSKCNKLISNVNHLIFSEFESLNSSVPMPVKNSLAFQVMVHADADGQSAERALQRCHQSCN